jgi:hypothetical protein
MISDALEELPASISPQLHDTIMKKATGHIFFTEKTLNLRCKQTLSSILISVDHVRCDEVG